jgi:MurNAc alpha-1-phosphate uridylyltransferase
MVPLMGRPMIDYSIDLCRDAGLDKLVVNTHYKAEHLHAHLAGTDIEISHEAQILDTGGGLKFAHTKLGGGAVCTINPDAVWSGPNPLKLLLEHWQPQRMQALLLCLEPQSTIGRTGPGDFSCSTTGELQRGGDLVFGGAQIINSDHVLNHQAQAFSLNVIWDQLIANGNCYGLTYPGNWCDIGYPAGLKQAETLLTARDAV